MSSDDWLTEGLSLYLRELLKELPEPYQRPLEMVELEGMTQVQMANALGLNDSAARSRVQRGREKLNTMVAACCDASGESGVALDGIRWVVPAVGRDPIAEKVRGSRSEATRINASPCSLEAGGTHI